MVQTEMERDCMISHGASRFLKERLFDVSNPYTVNVCNGCGNFTTTTVEGCVYCRNDSATTVNLSYAAKQLLLEVNAMNIKTVITTT
jgi:DNA-directed RNA polymerase II subunit RPB2